MKMSLTLTGALVVATVLARGAALAAPDRALAGTTLDDVRKRGVLVAGVKSASPPFGFLHRDSGEAAGYEVDVVRAVAARLGVKAIFTPVTAATRISRLLDGGIDIVAATMTRNPDRATLVDFSESYFVASQRVLAKKGTPDGPGGLRGRKIGTARGSAWEMNLRVMVPGAAVVAFDNSMKAAEALRKGEIDAVSTDERILAALLPKLPRGRFDILPTTISEEPYVMAVRKGDTAFLHAVDDAIREMTANGELRTIGDRWFGPAAASAPAVAAAGVVMRRSADMTRFVVMPIKDTFRPGADVSFFDPAGNFVAKGTVRSFYSDETYVDIDPARADLVDYGFVVVMNVPDAAARGLIREKQELLQSVMAQIRNENVARRAEIAAEEKARKAARRQEQVAFERQKMQLDYMYDDDDYRWHGTPGRDCLTWSCSGSPQPLQTLAPLRSVTFPGRPPALR